MTTSYNPRNTNKSDDDDALELNEANAPYLSNFAKRLSTLRAEPLDSGSPASRYTSLSGSTPKSVEYKSSYDNRYATQAAPKANPRKSGILKDLGQIYDSLDRQYNFRTILYIIFIVMVIVAIYVIFFM